MLCFNFEFQQKKNIYIFKNYQKGVVVLCHRREGKKIYYVFVYVNLLIFSSKYVYIMLRWCLIS